MKRIGMMIKRCGLLLIILMWTGAPHAMAQKAEADSAYQKGQYEVAARLYEQVLQEGDHAYVYYNLGNAYYRQGDMARAILNYERAALREPGNADIRFNLSLARSKTIDKVADTDHFFLVYWVRSLLNLQNADAWAWCALVAFLLLLAAVAGRIFASNNLVRRISAVGIGIGLTGALVFNLFAWLQHRQLLDKTHAILMQTVPVRSTPAESGTALFTLHPGTKVKITDDTMEQWKEIALPDGKKGWVQKNSIERI